MSDRLSVSIQISNNSHCMIRSGTWSTKVEECTWTSTIILREMNLCTVTLRAACQAEIRRV
jgi:Ca2+-dependent lipid-binding protein